MREQNVPPTVLGFLHKISVGQHGINVLLQWQQPCEQSIGLSPAGLEVVYAAQHNGRAQILEPMFDIFAAHPATTDNAVVESAAFVALQKFSYEHESQILLAGLRMNPEVNTHEFAAHHIAAGFLEDLANDRNLRGLASFDVTARLVQDDLSHRTFFDEQVFSVTLDDS
jgi:hypothetical protein